MTITKIAEYFNASENTVRVHKHRLLLNNDDLLNEFDKRFNKAMICKEVIKDYKAKHLIHLFKSRSGAYNFYKKLNNMNKPCIIDKRFYNRCVKIIEHFEGV